MLKGLIQWKTKQSKVIHTFQTSVWCLNFWIEISNSTSRYILSNETSLKEMCFRFTFSFEQSFFSLVAIPVSVSAWVSCSSWRKSGDLPTCSYPERTFAQNTKQKSRSGTRTVLWAIWFFPWGYQGTLLEATHSFTVLLLLLALRNCISVVSTAIWLKPKTLEQIPKHCHAVFCSSWFNDLCT